jgi:TonB family protein
MNRRPAPALAASLVLHAMGIALLMAVHSPEPIEVHSRRFTSLESPFRGTVPAVPVTSKPHIPSLRPPPAAPREFHVPDRLPPPKSILMVPDPPFLASPDVRPLEPIPVLLELPPAPVRRVVAATGAFDATPSNQASARTEITTGTFGNSSIAAAVARPSRNAPATILSPAEILSKPRPAYTDEARRLQIEGEVLLEVLFGASGEAQVLRMLRGLGHGLDENAIAAARAIHFRPAKRDGLDVDSSAVVHIVFRLAY